MNFNFKVIIQEVHGSFKPSEALLLIPFYPTLPNLPSQPRGPLPLKYKSSPVPNLTVLANGANQILFKTEWREGTEKSDKGNRPRRKNFSEAMRPCGEGEKVPRRHVPNKRSEKLLQQLR